MDKNQILESLYSYLAETIPLVAINLITREDIRVENFFAIHCGIYLDSLLEQNLIESYYFQHTILQVNRTHVDIIFTDNNHQKTYLELKHFSISQNRGNRNLRFYTSNSAQGKNVGIIGDCEKLDGLRNNNIIEVDSNLVCAAFITPKPSLEELNSMINRTENYLELEGWNLIFPVEFETQQENLGFLTFQK